MFALLNFKPSDVDFRNIPEKCRQKPVLFYSGVVLISTRKRTREGVGREGRGMREVWVEKGDEGGVGREGGRGRCG